MDIQKEREAFERLPDINVILHNSEFGFNEGINQYYHPNHAEHRLSYAFLMGAWSAWQAAKAKVVPEGFVLVKASDRDREVCELIDERDHLENQAEQLKDKLQNLYGVDFGEHSNCNFPFQNAIDFDDSDVVLMPKELSTEEARKHAEAMFNKVEQMARYEQRDLSESEFESFKNRWLEARTLTIQFDWKAMIEAQEQKG